MVKAKKKDFYREIKKSFSRYLSIAAIVALGVAFFSGVRASEYDMQMTADQVYDGQDFMDIRILGTMGLTDADVEAIQKIPEVLAAEGAYSAEVMCTLEDKEYAMFAFSDSDSMNRVIVEEGRVPKDETECFLDSSLMMFGTIHIGDTITVSSGTNIPILGTLKTDTFTVVGYGKHPQFLSWDRGTIGIGTGKADAFIVLHEDAFTIPVYNVCYATVEDAKAENSFSDAYQDKVAAVVEKAEELAEERCAPYYPASEWYVLDRSSIQNFVEYSLDTERIAAIARVFPVIFYLVATLVSLTTITRMIEEERTQIGTMKALGYGKWSIAAKYLGYAISATVLGCIVGTAVGMTVLPYAIVSAYMILYSTMPSIIVCMQWDIAFLASGIAIFCSLAATMFACYKAMIAPPSVLMRPTAPKEGRRVFLEYITPLWKRLKFTGKATIRNLFRYKKRFFMTVLGIGGCMGVLLVGFGLRDSIKQIVSSQYRRIWTYDAYATLDALTETEEDAFQKLLSEKDEVDESLLVSNVLRDVMTDTNEGERVTKAAYIFTTDSGEQIERFVSFHDRITKEKFHLQEDGVIISEKLARQFSLKAGDTFYIEAEEGKEFPVRVTAIVENYLYNYVYMTKECYRTVFGEEPKYNQLLLQLQPELSEEERESFAQQTLAMREVKAFTDVQTLEDKVSELMGSMNLVIWVLIVAAGLLAFVVIYNLNNINLLERYRELATIKVLGFYNPELAMYVYRENIYLTFFGMLAGVLIGKYLHAFVIETCEIDMIMFGREITPMSYLFSVLLTLFFSMLVNLEMYRKLRKIDMVESMKSVD